MKTRNILSIPCTVAMALVSYQAAAASDYGTGKIAVLAAYASEDGHSNYMTVNDFAAGTTTCPQLNGNARLAFPLNEEGQQMYSLGPANAEVD